MLITTLLALGAFSLTAEACGLTVHVGTSVEATRILEQLQANGKADVSSALSTLSLKSSLQAGSFFPDFGYNCRHKANESEAAHWPGFMHAALKHYHSIQDHADDLNQKIFGVSLEGKEELAAFLYGVVSHSVADISWHSMNPNAFGFIRFLSFLDFGGDFQKAHTAADVGTEFVRGHILSQPAAGIGYNWNVPLADVQTIFSSMNYSVSSRDLLQCMGIGYIGTQFLKNFGKLLYAIIAARSPALTLHAYDYYHGGLMDMAASVSYCWRDVQSSLDNTEGRVALENCKIYKDFDRNIDFQNSKNFTEMEFQTVSDRSKLVNEFVSWSRSNGNILSEIQNSLDISSEFAQNCVDVSKDFDVKVLKNVGHVTAINGNMLAIGNPYFTGKEVHEGRVGMSHLGENMEAFLTIESNEAMSRFGEQVLFIDFNDDGFDDLVVSAPSFGAKTLEYSGRVYIFFGPFNGTSLLNSKNADVIIDGTSGGMVRFGHFLKAKDVNGDGIPDLIIGNPFATVNDIKHAGLISVFFSSRQRNRMVINWNEASLIIYPPKPHFNGLFGSSFDFSEGKFLISSQRENAVYLFTQDGALIGSLQKKDHQYFGLDIVANNNHIYISSIKKAQFYNGNDGDIFRLPKGRWNEGTISLYKLNSNRLELVDEMHGSQTSSWLGYPGSFVVDDAFGLIKGEPLSNSEHGTVLIKNKCYRGFGKWFGAKVLSTKKFIIVSSKMSSDVSMISKRRAV